MSTIKEDIGGRKYLKFAYPHPYPFDLRKQSFTIKQSIVWDPKISTTYFLVYKLIKYIFIVDKWVVKLYWLIVILWGEYGSYRRTEKTKTKRIS
jgi:hypothetical protein